MSFLALVCVTAVTLCYYSRSGKAETLLIRVVTFYTPCRVLTKVNIIIAGL